MAKTLPLEDYLKLVANLSGIDPNNIRLDIGGTSFTIKTDQNAPTKRPKKPDWAKTLRIDNWQAATVPSVRKAYRELSKSAHPDRGGSQELQTVLNKALHSALEALE